MVIIVVLAEGTKVEGNTLFGINLVVEIFCSCRVACVYVFTYLFLDWCGMHSLNGL